MNAMTLPIALRLLPAALFLAVPASAQQPDASEPDSGEGSLVVDQAEALHLRDGSIHWGAIRGHDPDAIEFQRLDTGGLVRVRWELLDPVQTEELQLRFGYVQFASEELRIDADLLVLDGGEEVIGRIVSREGDVYLVKTGGNLQNIPKARVVGMQSGLSVPALDVFTREEIYAQYLAEAAPDSAADQYELAETCERILDYAHALEHYDSAKRLDPTFHQEDIDGVIERTRVAAGQQEQIDYLRDIDTLRKRGKYDEAIANAAAFGTRWPDSPLVTRALKIQTQVEDARWRAIMEFVRKRWYTRLLNLVQKAALEKDYAQAVTYGQEELGQEVREQVLADARQLFSKDLELEHIDKAWKERRRVRYVSASYGIGTWLLGEEAALKGAEEESEETEPVSEKDAERVKLEEKIKRFLANQEAARKSQSRADQAEDFDAFWANFSAGGRAQWILAYYAEYGGDVEVRPKPYLEACRDCAATGVREVIYLGESGPVIQRCPRCMGIGVVRKVYFH